MDRVPACWVLCLTSLQGHLKESFKDIQPELEQANESGLPHLCLSCPTQNKGPMTTVVTTLGSLLYSEVDCRIGALKLVALKLPPQAWPPIA